MIPMKTILFLLFSLFISLNATEKASPPFLTSKGDEAITSDAPQLTSYVRQPDYVPKVNIFTGEYSEEETDLVVAGCEPLSLRRFYNHMSPTDYRWGSWRINPETSVVANFEWKRIPLFASVGDESGAVYCFEDAENFPFTEKLAKRFCGPNCTHKDHVGIRFFLGPNTKYTYANGNPNEESGQLDPINTSIVYWKELHKDTHRWKGFVEDGTGRSREFDSSMFTWHHSKKIKDGKIHVDVDSWIPYSLPVSREILPNGNIIRYEYTHWRTEKEFPRPQLLTVITAYNKEETKVLGKINIHYALYGWKRKINASVDQDMQDVAAFHIVGSDQRSAYCQNNKRKKPLPVQLQSAQTPSQTTHYTYNESLLVQVDKGDGRIFQTAYNPHTYQVMSQHAPVGPNGAMAPVGQFFYYHNYTEVWDANNNKVIYNFDDKKRLLSVAKHGHPYSVENYIWNKENRLEAKTIQNSQEIVHRKSFVYDKFGNLLEETLHDKGGNYTITRTYDRNLKITESDGLGKVVHYTYVPDTNLIASEIVAGRKRTFYTYDDCAICVKKIIDDGVTNNPNDLTGVTYRKITVIQPKQSLPCFGLPEQIEEKTIDGSGREILLEKVFYVYHPSGQIEREDHYDSNLQHRYTISHQYDGKERLISTIDPLGIETLFEYDNQGNLLKKTRGNEVQRWEYDLANRPILEQTGELIRKNTYDNLGQLITTTDECGNTTHFTYDHAGRITKTIFPDGAEVLKEYDVLGNVIRETDPKGFQTLREFNSRGQQTRVCNPDGSEEKFAYYPNGNLSEHIDKNGSKTTYTYDVFDHPIETRSHSKTTSATFSPFCKLSEKDAEGFITKYTYDFAGHLLTEEKNNRVIRYAYDPLFRLTHTTQGDVVSIQEFDLLDRVIEKRKEDLSGNVHFKENYRYDAASNQTQVITCEGVTQTVYNAQNLPIKQVSPDGNVTSIKYSYQGGYTKTTTDPKVEIIEIHDSCKRLKEIQVRNKKLLQHREFRYDLSGNQTHAIEHVLENGTPLKTTTTTWEYGANNHLEKLLESGEKLTQYIYDKGKLATLIKPDGTKIHHIYDDQGRLSRLHAKDIDYHYTYDRNDRLISVYDKVNNTTTQRKYDPLNNLLEENLSNGLTLKSLYNDRNQKTKIFYPDKTTAAFSYKGGFLHQVNLSYRGVFQTEYNEYTYTYEKRNLSGKTTNVTLPVNLGSITIGYTPSLRWKSFTSPYYTAINFAYDKTGNLTSYLYTDTLGTVTAQYLYDDLNQVIGENEHTYHYDSLYNRIRKDTFHHTVNTLNQITHDGEKNYTYDANGNLIQSGDTLLSYDSLDRLVKVVKNGRTYEYIYDSFHRRVCKKTPWETIPYLWDDKNEVGSNKDIRVLGEGLGAEIGATIFAFINGRIYVPIHDQRGNIIAFLDRYKNVTEAYRYTAYGEELTGNTFSPWRFSSKRVDDETNYSYFGRRYYDPKLGRWISTDPRGFGDGPNLYAYVKNCPLTAFDLYGEYAWQDSWPKLQAWGKSGLELAFPAGYAFYNLPKNAPMWQRGVLGGAAVIEILSYACPLTRGAAALAGRGAIHVTRSAAERLASRELMTGIRKTSDVVAPKIGGSASRKLGREVGKAGSSEWKFPKDPSNLLKDLPRDSKGRIYTSDNLRIRPEKHPFEPGDVFNQRHHGQHYHVETRRNPNIGWRNENTKILKPQGYKPGSGTGFLPDEFFPGS